MVSVRGETKMEVVFHTKSKYSRVKVKPKPQIVIGLRNVQEDVELITYLITHETLHLALREIGIKFRESEEAIIDTVCTIMQGSVKNIYHLDKIAKHKRLAKYLFSCLTR